MINGKPLLAMGSRSPSTIWRKKRSLAGQLVGYSRPVSSNSLFGSRRWRRCSSCSELFAPISNSKFRARRCRALLREFVLFSFSSVIILPVWRAGKQRVFFVLGVTLVLIEVLFFAHSTIIFGVVGAFLILASLFWAMIDRYPDQPLVPSTKMLLVPMLNLSIAIIASMIVIALLARYLPRTSFYRRFALMAANPSGHLSARRENSSPAGLFHRERAD